MQNPRQIDDGQFEKYFAAIGAAIVAFNSAEAQLNEVIGILLYCDEPSTYKGTIVASKCQLGDKIEMAKALVNERFRGDDDQKHVIDEFAALCKEFDSCRSARNTLVHRNYGVIDRKDGRMMTSNPRTPKGRIHYGEKKLEVEDLVSLRLRFGRLSSGIGAFWSRHLLNALP